MSEEGSEYTLDGARSPVRAAAAWQEQRQCRVLLGLTNGRGQGSTTQQAGL